MNVDLAQKEDLVRQIARSAGIEYVIITHKQGGSTTADAENALQESSERILKTLVLIDERAKKSVGIIIRGDKRLSMQKLKKLTGLKKLKFASAEQVEAITGFSLGGVPPVAVIRCDIAIVSTDVLLMDYVIGAGGHPYCGMKFSPNELRKIPKILEVSVSI
ncbi:MAG: hypothetical protein A3E36_02250 [Candidatus Andersenbacteria bacterium RIFCSPHIGHO2_12_FULL_45_11b]|uniref:YbaK/aminoacyl-tRNA synthetase-associated domain-containing protein n=2 Tax=Parcubacteria group TaxID=1794811 RepID=A0A1G2FU57_9BACT|nr:MAG: hypothetical protein A3E36_02250 [Candidatus Andersenbacteria bacterium RIFCSPHIGHO2_12_FULL_45_11b]OGZ41573.1 MAG: hypothetical protein A2W41_00455 [Candidatus Ryanbacteria bacterium RIFCSPHIGHO2_01_45_13]